MQNAIACATAMTIAVFQSIESIHCNFSVTECVCTLQVKTVFASNLPSGITVETVREKFATYGSIKDCKRMKDFAFIEFENREEALKAVQELHGTFHC